MPNSRKKHPIRSDEALAAYYGLPKIVAFCTKCVISNQRPNSTVEFKNNSRQERKETIGFSSEGICSACLYAEEKKKLNWREREEKLIKLCRDYRSKKGFHDCIVPGSGGKDSAFTAFILKNKYGMHPLTVTWAPHIYTEIGMQNFQNWIQAGFDNILISPNGKVRRLLTRLSFLNLLHPFQSFIIGQRHIAPKFSVKYGIPLIFYGENPAEYGNDVSENNSPIMPRKFYEGEIGPKKLFLGGVSGSDLFKKYRLSVGDLAPYLPEDHKALNRVGTVVHYLGYYLRWDPQENYYYASRNTNFRPNPERTEGSYSKYSSIDDKMDPLHYFTTLIKFGIGRATYDAAQEIRNGKITREEGIALVKKYDGEFPKKYFSEILEYMDISQKIFWEKINKARSPHLWKYENGEWQLRHTIWQDNKR